MAPALPLITAGASLAGGAASLSKGILDKPQQQALQPGSPHGNFNVQQLGTNLPTTPQTISAGGGSSAPPDPTIGMPRNYGLYGGSQNLDLLTALQGIK